MHDGLFYWTNGDQMIREELDPFTNMYHHNQMFFFDTPFTGLNLWHPSAQPIPVPLGPPKNIQATFKSDSAHIMWDLPEIDQGRCTMSCCHTILVDIFKATKGGSVKFIFT